MNGSSRPLERRSAAAALRRRIGARLAARRETLTCVEIGSGGRVSQAFTAEPGSSAFFACALILTADAAAWPRALTGDGDWHTEPPGSRPRLHGLAALAQRAFNADWGLAVECASTPSLDTVRVALCAPDGSTIVESASLTAEASHSGGERLVQCVLAFLIKRLEEHGENPP